MHVGLGLLTLFPRRVGGTESYVRSLLAEFARGNGPDEVTILANRHVADAYREFVGGPVSLDHVRSYRAGNGDLTRALAMAAARALPRRAARDVPAGLDVLHLPVTVPIPQLDVPTVVTINEVQYHELPDNFSALERRYRRWAYDGSARSADIVIAISQYVADKLVERVGIPPDRIELAYYGIDHDHFRLGPVEGDERLLAPLGLPERFVLYPANLWPHKNHPRLLDAFSMLDDEVVLVLAGQAYGRLESLQRKASSLGIAGRLLHIGHHPPPTLAALYRRAAAMVYPSLHEGFGLPPLEAMACGCPVASATNTSLAEVCGGDVVALDAEDSESIAQGIARVTADSALRATLRERGLKRAERFSWAAAAARHVEIYRRAAAT